MKRKDPAAQFAALKEQLASAMDAHRLAADALDATLIAGRDARDAFDALRAAEEQRQKIEGAIDDLRAAAAAEQVATIMTRARAGAAASHARVEALLAQYEIA
jgi:hypothetical protein